MKDFAANQGLGTVMPLQVSSPKDVDLVNGVMAVLTRGRRLTTRFRAEPLEATNGRIEGATAQSRH